MGVLRETTGGEQFSHAWTSAGTIDSGRALRAAAAYINFMADLSQWPCCPTMLRVVPARQSWRQLSTACRFFAVPALLSVPRHLSRSHVARVHVSRIAVPEDMFLPRSAARGAVRAPPHHDGIHGGRWRCADDEHRRLLAKRCAQCLPRRRGTNHPPPPHLSASHALLRASMPPRCCPAAQP